MRHVHMRVHMHIHDLERIKTDLLKEVAFLFFTIILGCLEDTVGVQPQKQKQQEIKTKIYHQEMAYVMTSCYRPCNL